MKIDDDDDDDYIHVRGGQSACDNKSQTRMLRGECASSQQFCIYCNTPLSL